MKPLFTFIHVTDTHLTKEVDVIIPFIQAVNTEQFHPRPDVVIFGGDNISGNRDDGAVCATEMPMLKERLDRLEVPYLITCHNHDTWGESHLGTQYRKYFGDEALTYTRDFPGGFRGIFISGMFERDGKVIDIYDQVDWLDAALSEAKDKKVLLFSHVPLFPPRKPVPPPLDRNLLKPTWHAGHFYFKPQYAGPITSVIRRHKNVLAHYCGHCHVNSVLQREGVYHVATAALATRPWEYRYVQVFPDRITHTCVCPHAVRIMKFSAERLAWLKEIGMRREDVERQGAFWLNCVDEDHPTVEIYHDGLPHERDFTIPF